MLSMSFLLRQDQTTDRSIRGRYSPISAFAGDPPPSTEKPEGPYPWVITQPDGHLVPVLEAYAFGKYLGYFQTTFDDGGKLVNWTGNPILLNGSVEQGQNRNGHFRSTVPALRWHFSAKYSVIITGSWWIQFWHWHVSAVSLFTWRSFFGHLLRQFS